MGDCDCLPPSISAGHASSNGANGSTHLPGAGSTGSPRHWQLCCQQASGCLRFVPEAWLGSWSDLFSSVAYCGSARAKGSITVLTCPRVLQPQVCGLRLNPSISETLSRLFFVMPRFDMGRVETRAGLWDSQPKELEAPWISSFLPLPSEKET